MSARLMGEGDILSLAQEIKYPLRGVYFLIKNGEIIYIGQTPNLFRRIGEHIPGKTPTHYAFIPVPEPQDLTRAERLHINKFRPALNRHKDFVIDAPAVRKGSRNTAGTKRALALIAAGEVPYRAAKKTGIALSTIYRAIARQRARKA